jgi:FecR protein
MTRRPAPPIPSPSDSALNRIERGVFSALDAHAIRPDRARESRRRFFAFALAGAAAMGVVFGVREWRRGDTLPAHTAQISTTTSGSHIAIAGAALDIAPQSAVSFGGGRDGAVVVILDRGTVTCEVAPRSKRAPFIVEAGATRVTVIGTRFSVHRVGEHATVSVEHGLVEVADTNMTELVHAGERYRPGEPVTREPLASEAPGAVSLAPGPAGPALPAFAGEPSAAAAVSVPAVPPVPSGSSLPLASSLHQLARQVRHRRLALADGAAVEKERPAGTPMESSAPPAPVELAPIPAPAEPVAPEVRPAGAARASIQVLFELAAQLEVRDPAAALRIYGELAAGEDGWAASALFAAARLEGERGQAGRARTLCEAYLQRFPQGPNTDDARALLATLR